MQFHSLHFGAHVKFDDIPSLYKRALYLQGLVDNFKSSQVVPTFEQFLASTFNDYCYYTFPVNKMHITDIPSLLISFEGISKRYNWESKVINQTKVNYKPIDITQKQSTEKKYNMTK
jgi:hypothetical protein